MNGGIYWRRWGEGEPRTVLLHCAMAQSSVLDGLAKALDRPAAGPDFPGHGASAPHDPDGDFGDQSLAAVQAGLSDVPVDLIGHSFGGVIGLRLALEDPHAVRRLVLIEPALVAAARDSEVFAAYRGAERQVSADVQAGRREAAARGFNANWGGLPWNRLFPERQGELRRMIHIIPAMNSAVVVDAPGLLTPGRLEALSCPVLLIQGSASPPIAGAIMEALAARLPGAERVWIERAGHMSPLSHPKAVGQAVKAFLAG